MDQKTLLLAFAGSIAAIAMVVIWLAQRR